jgi:HD-like signal output (HDOD) protein
LSENLDFERLILLTKRASCLPALPTTATRLIELIDRGEASVTEIEKITIADPSLCAKLIRAASIGIENSAQPVNTVRAAILRLGQSAVRNMALSLSIQEMIVDSDGASKLDPVRFARHGLFVGTLARYVFARRLQRGEVRTALSAEEVFSVGLLHDLAVGILARAAPRVFNDLYLHAESTRNTIDRAFIDIYRRPMTALALQAVDAWRLPGLFSIILAHLAEPWTHMDEFASLSGIHYADVIAERHGAGIGPWPCDIELDPIIADEVALPEEELNAVIPLITSQVDAYNGLAKAA